jgi:hypothetical protein
MAFSIQRATCKLLSKKILKANLLHQKSSRNQSETIFARAAKRAQTRKVVIGPSKMLRFTTNVRFREAATRHPQDYPWSAKGRDSLIALRGRETWRIEK